MAQDVVLKRSATADKIPTTSDLALGEIAINTNDGKMFIKKDDGTAKVVEIGSAGVNIDTKEPTGFLNRTDSTISFANTNRRLTIAPAVTSYDYYIQGDKYTISASKTIDITDVEGLHFIYIGTDEALHEITTFTIDTLFKDNAYIVVVYWDATNNNSVYVGDERHGAVMDWATHEHLHQTLGAQYVDGFALGDIVADGDGDSATHAQLSVDNGNMRDEDILHYIADGSPQDISPIAKIPMLYRVGATGEFRIITATDYPVTTTGTGRAAYNEWTGSTWQLTEVTNNRHVLTHIYATNDINNPIIGLVGQNEYSTIANARDGANEEIGEIGILPYEEYIALGTVIFATSDGSTNAVQSAIVSTDTGEDYIDWRTAKLQPGIPQGDHNSLAGRTDTGAHPASAVSYSNTTSGLTATAVKDAIDELVEKAITTYPLNYSTSNDENWVKIGTIDGGVASVGANIQGILSGLDTYTENQKSILFFNFSQYNDVYECKVNGLNIEDITSPSEFYVKRIDIYEFELWVKLDRYIENPNFSLLTKENATIDCQTLKTSDYFLGTLYPYELTNIIGVNSRTSVETASSVPTDTIFTRILTARTSNASGDTDFTWAKVSGSVSNTFVIWFDTSDYLRLKIMTSSLTISTTNYCDNKDHRIGFVYNSTNQTLKTYIDGYIIDNRTGVDEGAVNRIGYLFDSGTNTEQAMRNVQSWTQEFTDTQMLFDFQNQDIALYERSGVLYSDNSGVNTANCVQWFPLNEGSGTTFEEKVDSENFTFDSSDLSWNAISSWGEVETINTIWNSENLVIDDYARKASDETISGDWDFTGSLNVTNTDYISPVKITTNITDPSLPYYFGQKIIAHLSGSDPTGGSLWQGGLHIDVNSSTTGGDTTDEHRAVGLFVDVDVNGDSDYIVGVKAYVDVNNSEGTISSVVGGSFEAVADNSGSGIVGSILGLEGRAYTDNSGTASAVYGAHLRASTLDDGGNIDTAYGVWGEVENNNSSSTIINGKAHYSYIDHNAGIITNGFLYNGNYSGDAGTVTNKWGIYLGGSEKNQIDGYLNLNGDLTVDGDIFVGSGTQVKVWIPPVGAITNTTEPLCHLPLISSLEFTNGVGVVEFTRDGNATYIDKYGVLKKALTDEPRFERKGLLMEAEAINVLTYSQTFENAIWQKITDCTVIDNDAIAPDGSKTAAKLTKTADAYKYMYHGYTATTGEDYTFTAFMKAGTSSVGSFAVNEDSLSTVLSRHSIDFTTGVITSSHGTATATKIDNDWWKIECTAAITQEDVDVIFHPGVYNAAVAGNIYIWGAQLEKASFGTSYIATTTTAITRKSDKCYFTAPNNYTNKSEYGLTISLNVTTIIESNNTYLFGAYVSASNYLRVYTDFDSSTYKIFFQGYSDDGQSGNSSFTNPTDEILDDATITAVFSSSDIKYYIDGELIYTNSTIQENIVNNNFTPYFSIGDYNYLYDIETFKMNGNIKNIRFWDKALSAEEVRVI